WGGDIVKVVQSEFSVTYSFTFYESINADVLKAVYGDDNVASTAADTTHGNQHAIQVKSDQLPRGPWLFEVKDGDARIRIHVPVGQITTVGEVTYSDESVIGYPVTVEAFADSNGVQAYTYIDDGKLAAWVLRPGAGYPCGPPAPGCLSPSLGPRFSSPPSSETGGAFHTRSVSS